MRHTYPTPPEAVNESEASRDKKMALDQPVVSLWVSDDKIICFPLTDAVWRYEWDQLE